MVKQFDLTETIALTTFLSRALDYTFKQSLKHSKKEGVKPMDIDKAYEIVTFLKNLSADEKSFVRQLLHETAVENFIKTAKKVRVNGKKGKKNGKYTPKQIRKAWDLLKKGVSAKEIARRTRMNESVVGKSYLAHAMKRFEKK